MTNNKSCEFCGEPMPLQAVGRPARFCCRACSDEFFKEERKQAVAFFRRSGMSVQRPEQGEAA
jgi:hypothetical protein